MKKGQLEDLFADLIPSIIILVIAVVFLSFLSEKQVNDVENKLLELKSKNVHETDFQLLLKMDLEKLLPKKVIGEFEKKGDNVGRLKFSDVIRLSSSKEAKYPGLEMLYLNQYILGKNYFEKLPFRGEESDWEFYLVFVPIVHGLKLLGVDEAFVEIIYSDGVMKEIGEEIIDPKIKAEFSIPQYDGGEIKLKIKGR